MGRKPKSAKESADEDNDADAHVIQKALLNLNKPTPTNVPSYLSNLVIKLSPLNHYWLVIRITNCQGPTRATFLSHVCPSMPSLIIETSPI
jgi:hypothetical protein